MTNTSELIDATPSAALLIESIRDIGYSLETAIADLVDNSISAGAKNIDILLLNDDDDKHLAISYCNTVGLLVEAIKELEARVKEQENK